MRRSLSQSCDCYYYEMGRRLGSDRISAMAQDRLGRLWIGTQSGVARYDGVEFVTYTVRNGLAGNSILRLLPGPEGSVFVVTAQGVAAIRAVGSDGPRRVH